MNHLIEPSTYTGTQLPPKGAQPPIFGPCLLWPNGSTDQDATRLEVDLGPGNIVLDGDPAPPKRGTAAPTFHPCLLWPCLPSPYLCWGTETVQVTLLKRTLTSSP